MSDRCHSVHPTPMVGRSNTQAAMEKLVGRFGQTIVWVAMPIFWLLIMIVAMSPINFLFGGMSLVKSMAHNLSAICIPASVGAFFGGNTYYSMSLPRTMKYVVAWSVFGITAGLAAIIFAGLFGPRQFDRTDYAVFFAVWAISSPFLGLILSVGFKKRDT